MTARVRDLLLPLPPLPDVCTSTNCPPGVTGCTPVLVAWSDTQINLYLPAEIQSLGCVLKPGFFFEHALRSDSLQMVRKNTVILTNCASVKIAEYAFNYSVISVSMKYEDE